MSDLLSGIPALQTTNRKTARVVSPDGALTAKVRQRPLVRTLMPVAEAAVTGRLARRFRFHFRNHGDPRRPGVRTWDFVLIEAFEPIPGRKTRRWRNAGQMADPSLTFPYDEQARTIPDAVLDACGRFALELAEFPMAQEMGEPGLTRTDDTLTLVFLPDSARDDDGDAVTLTLTRDGTLRVSEWKPWMSHRVAERGAFTTPSWSTPIVAATGLDATAVFAEADPTDSLIALFWDHANERLPDPFLHSGDDPWFHGQDPVWVAGSEEEFTHLVRMFVWTEPQVSYPYEISIDGETDLEPAKLPKYEYIPDTHSPRLRRLVELALKEHRVRGWHVEYNDGVRNRRSGFSHYAETVDLTIEAPSAHERLEAVEQLDAWLRTRVSEEERKTLSALA